MQRTSADGVTVLWTPAPTPGPLTAQLTFGTGIRDETAPTLGVTHVIESLVMSEVGSRPHAYSSSVREDLTEFTAKGTPEDVTGFLLAICRALFDLPLHRTSQATGLLSGHAARTPVHHVAEPLGALYGPHASGLITHAHPGMYAALTPETVRAHATARFTCGNAVLALDGPPPPGLALPLPEGPPPHRATPRTRPHVPGSWQHRPVDTVSLLLACHPSDAAATMAQLVLRHRVERAACTVHDISADIGAHWFLRGHDTLDRALVIHPRPGRTREAAVTLWQETLRLTRKGPTPAELDTLVHDIRSETGSVWGSRRPLERAVVAEHFAIPYIDDDTLFESYADVTPQAVRTYLERALDDAVLVVPHKTRQLHLRTPQGAALPNSDCWHPHGRRPPTPGTRYRMNPLRRAVTRRRHHGEYVLTPWGIVVRDAHRDEHDIRFDEIALMRHEGPGRIVLTGCGCEMHLHPHQVAHGEHLIAALDAAVPAHLVHTTP
ncbi:hypothetical protein [Streptomyces sp. NPDC096339]|uniref:hypothetical protein n=1 Tax=Streptomyces sp. NPDC096339 TaxID=3366086 RepID=UPI00380B5723